MIKQMRSWSKDSDIPNLIGKKKVDWSIFEYGSHIPIEFHVDFIEANGGDQIEVGKSKKLQLIHGTQVHDGLLSNIDQRSSGRVAFQLRYDSNKELKTLMINTFKATHDHIAAARAQGNGERQREQIKVPEDQAEYIEFYSTGIPYRYEMKFYPTSNIQRATPNVWWVNQGATLSVEQAEGILWAPLRSANDRAMYHWDTMDEVKAGDIILHYANGALRFVSQATAAVEQAPKPSTFQGSGDAWGQEGRLVRVQYHTLELTIPLPNFASAIAQLNIPQGPIHTANGVKQGYLFRFSIQALQVLQAHSSGTNWPDFTKFKSDDPTDEDEVVEMVPIPDTDVNSTIQAIKSHIQNKGFTYPEHLIENFYLSLKTKPFVILAGISGTGKTKLVKLFADALGATEANKQFTLIPVRPDWSDPSDLIGYKDLSNVFRPGKLTEVLVEASKRENRGKPFFICLDEMNLARVEHYFSDMLSILETQRRVDGRIETDTVVPQELLGTAASLEYNKSVIIPDNVFIIGTVNMDETTHPFSKKVLDRANTLEFNYINLQDYPEADVEAEPETLAQVPSSFLRADYLNLQEAYANYTEISKRTTEKLVKINDILEEIHSHIGFRVRDAVCFYMIYNQRFGLMAEEWAFDLQLLQKILPRIQGSSQSVKRVLVELMLMCLGQKKNVEELVNDASELYKPWRRYADAPQAVYPQSARKIAYMLRRLEDDGFTSFWIS